MGTNDHWTETLRRKEKTDEDRYFAEQDRRLIEQRHRHRSSGPVAEPPASASAVSADPAQAPADSATPESVKP